MSNLFQISFLVLLKKMEKHRKRKKELAAYLVVDDAVKAAKQLRDEERKRYDDAESVQVR